MHLLSVATALLISVAVAYVSCLWIFSPHTGRLFETQASVMAIGDSTDEPKPANCDMVWRNKATGGTLRY